MARKKLSFTSRYVLAFGLLMLLTNTLLGVIIREAAHADMRFFEPEPVSLYADFIRRVTK